MLQIKRLIIIFLVLFCCCSKSDSEIKKYKTNVFNRLSIFADPNKRYQWQEIGEIPFKERVEIVDTKEVKIDDYSFIKIKYNDTIGYVYSTYLSERSDIPFVDKIKYDYNLTEFEYNRKIVIDFTKKAMIEYGLYGSTEKLLSNKYYIDDPQIYSFYGKDCNGRDRNFILVIMISKLHKNFNHYIIFTKENENEYYPGAFGSGSFTENVEGIKDYIEANRSGDSCP